MCRNHWMAIALLMTLAMAGCSGGPSKRTVVTNEPGLSTVPGESGVAVIDSPKPASSVAFVDRHPLFSKPRQYYTETNSNKVVKTAAAAVVGVPTGIYGELKQIVVGAPQPVTVGP